MTTMFAGARPKAERAAPSWRRRGEANSVHAACPRRRKAPERPRPACRTTLRDETDQPQTLLRGRAARPSARRIPRSMRQGLVTGLVAALIAAGAALAALPVRADDPPAPPPVSPVSATKKPVKTPAPEVLGIRWETDLDAGFARAAREGRGVFLAVNALEGEGANEMLSREAYPSQAWGKASRPFVCFVGTTSRTRRSGGRTAPPPARASM